MKNATATLTKIRSLITVFLAVTGEQRRQQPPITGEHFSHQTALQRRGGLEPSDERDEGDSLKPIAFIHGSTLPPHRAGL